MGLLKCQWHLSFKDSFANRNRVVRILNSLFKNFFLLLKINLFRKSSLFCINSIYFVWLRNVIFFSDLTRYEKYHVYHGGDEETKKTNYSDMVRQ